MFSLNFNFGIPQPNVGSIYTRMDKGEFSPGEQITGTILLDLYTNFQSNQVWLTIAGVEQVHLAEFRLKNGGQDQGQPRDNQAHFDSEIHEKIIHDDKNFFFNHQIPVYTFPGGFIPAGQYSFPFCFVLPPGLPSTFEHTYTERDETCFGKVSYEMRASLENSVTRTAAISHCLPLFVNQPTQLINDSSRKELKQNIVSCCCLNKGETQIITYFEKMEYYPGEVAYMVTEADNSHSKAKINSITANFDQKLELQAKGYKKTISNTLNQMSEPGINPGEKKTEANAVRMAVSLTAVGKNARIVQPTCRGKLITNEYYLINTLHVDACLCCDQNPHCHLMLNVRNPSQNYAPWANQPTKWNPQVMGMASLQLNNDYRFDPMAMPRMLGSPTMPGMPGSPTMPGMPGSPTMPGTGPMPGMPVMPGAPY